MHDSTVAGESTNPHGLAGVRYSPGFQADLTSWSLKISPEGKAWQVVEICRFAPEERRTETHRCKLTAGELSDLIRHVEGVDFREVARQARRAVLDDVEQVLVSVRGPDGERGFSAPLEQWAWQEEGGDEMSREQRGAVALWRVIQALSRYKLSP